MVRQLPLPPLHEREPRRDGLLHAPQVGHAGNLDKSELRGSADGHGDRALSQLASQVALDCRLQSDEYLGIIQSKCWLFYFPPSTSTTLIPAIGSEAMPRRRRHYYEFIPRMANCLLTGLS